MNTPPQPRLEAKRTAETGDLDARILHAEQALIARDERLRRGVAVFGQRLQQALQPRRLLVPAAGGAAAIVGTWWLLRSRRPRYTAHAATPSASAGQTQAVRPPVPWVRLIGFVWPLMPQHWRSKISPTTTSALFTFGLPMVEKLMHQRPDPPLLTAPAVDLSRYAGTWNEIARLPAPFEAVCTGQPSATYTPGLGLIDVANRCRMPGGKLRTVHGVARVVPGGNGAKLQVSMFPRWLRWMPFAWADYWIIDLDANYTTALVGNPSRTFLWVLARNRTVPPQTLQRLIEVARSQGFRVDRLNVVEPV